MLDTSSVFINSFSGIVFKDALTGKIIFSKNANKYFVPASNNKLFTLYAGLKCLGDSIPSIRYAVNDTAFYFKGMGDPTFLHPEFNTNFLPEFLKSLRNKKIYYTDSHFRMPHFGNGWMWDDYNYGYQPELSPLPVFGNLAAVHIENGFVDITPPLFRKNLFVKDTTLNVITRSLASNDFIVPLSLMNRQKLKTFKPFITNRDVISQLLADSLGLDVFYIDTIPEKTQTLYTISVDTVYRKMMVHSNNMLAEQILLMVSAMISDTMDTQIAIDYVMNRYLNDLKDKPKWVDGSGLSRYNLFTPSSIIYILEKLYAETEQERLLSFMAIGGEIGTLYNMFIDVKPYVYAKSGTLGGVYNLSGFLFTRSGKTVIFSVMNNNFNIPVSEVRLQVEKIINLVREKY